MKNIIAVLTVMLALTGCAQSPGWNKGASQPRALLHSIEMPFCIWWCTITASITSTESGNAGQVRAGDVSLNQTYAPVETDSHNKN